MTKRCGKPSNRWISSEAIAARRSRSQLERRYRQSKKDAYRLAYRAACRRENNLIKKSRRQYFITRLEDSIGDARGRWKIIKELLHMDDRSARGDFVENQAVCDGLSVYFIDKIGKIAISLGMLSGLEPSPFCPVGPSGAG